jgi:alginate O-acetyltransferase complex protein AlgJ
MQIDFTSQGNADPFVVSGFSAPERLGRWSVGSQSVVKLPAPPGGGALDVQVTLLPMTVEGKLPAQKLMLLANGQPVHSGTHSGWETLKLRLPASVAGHVTLTFIHPDAAAPSALGKSGDDRRLAFLFRGIAIEATQAAEASPLPPPGEVALVAPSATVSPDVWVADEGWLFLIGGTNAVLRYYTDPNYFTEAHVLGWAGLLAGRRARLARMGVQYFHLAAPDKISVYPELMRGDLPNRHRHPIKLLDDAMAAGGMADVLLNPLPEFARHPQRDRLFLKTDTHWTYVAALTVIGMLTARIGAPRTPTLAGRQIRTYRHTLDLGIKITPPVTEEAFAVVSRPDLKRAHVNELAEKFEANAKLRKPVVHNGINVVFRSANPEAIDKTLVIFGDSFMDFQESTPTVALAEQFRETHFVWSPRIDYGYVARAQADIVLTEIAERFMNQLPSDDYNLDRDVFQRLAAYPA